MSDSPRRINRIAVFLIVVLVLAIGAVIVYAVLGTSSYYTSWEAVSSFENTSETGHIEADNGYIAYNSDGAKKYDLSRNPVWNISFVLEDPIAASVGKYAVFADRGGESVHVTDGTGSNHSFTVSDKISEVCIADKGTTAIRTNGGDHDNICLYDIDGNMLIDLKTDVRKSGLPITMALSPDGKKLVTSYFEVGQENKSWLTFYNFDDVGQNYADKIVGSYSYDEKLIVDIRFLNDSKVIVFYADGCDVYKMREIPEPLKSLRFDGGIEAVCSSGEGFAIARKETGGDILITVYDLNGKQISSINSSMSFDTMRLEDGELILTQDDSCVIYRSNGEEKVRARFNDVIRFIRRGKSKTEYVVVGGNRTDVIRLRTLKEDSAEAVDE